MPHHNHHTEAIDLADKHQTRIYLVCIVINLLFSALEAGIGNWSGSLGLVSDAGHNLCDTFSLILAMVGMWLSFSMARKRYTYGYRKASVLLSLVNALILLVAVILIVAESIRKFRNPVGIDGRVMAWTAAVAIVVNGLTTFLLSKNDKHDLNARGAFLHMAADTLVSVGVVVSGIVIKYTGWTAIDPIVSLVIAAVILVSTWHLLSESVRLCIDGVPESIHPDKVEEEIAATQGVLGVHHIHVWPISTTETALTAHIVVASYADGETVVPKVKAVLKGLGIGHTTIEVETEGHCSDKSCR